MKGQPSRPVLRGGRGGNAASLPDPVLNMMRNGLALLQQFGAPGFQLRGDKLDAGGLFNGFGFNLAGVMISQLRFGHFDYRMVGMSGQ